MESKTLVPNKTGYWWRKTNYGNWTPQNVNDTPDGLRWDGLMRKVEDDGLWGGYCKPPSPTATEKKDERK